MKIIETGPREIGFVSWGHCQNLLDDPRIDGAHGIGVQNVTSNYNVATLNSFSFSLYLARRFASGETYIRW